MGKHNRPDDIPTTDRCIPADPSPDPLAVRVSPTWRGEATTLRHAGSAIPVTLKVEGESSYRLAKTALSYLLMETLGDNVSLQLMLEADSFCEFMVVDHDGVSLGDATIEEVKHDNIV
ncbi:hypothetical protein SEA_DIABLA_99 [Gordonia phage Diabla]|nr:hypothetical protein SEA_DIABLA_99 [Gordonia phage Diabla]